MPSPLASRRVGHLAAPAALLAAALAGLAACAPPAAPPDGVGSVAPLPAEPAASGQPAATSGRTFNPGRPMGADACRLPQPLRSEDSCSTDADCGPSSPCHAKACVAAAKAQRPTPDTMCTQSLECDSADVNRCGCLEGRCALIPPA